MRASPAAFLSRGVLLISAALLACFEAPALAGSATGSLAGATFINSAQPNNNNGAAPNIYVGNNAADYGALRGLVRFNVPGSLSGRTTITYVSLQMTTAALNGGVVPTAATVSLGSLAENWGQGNGIGTDYLGNFTAGQPCSLGGATWNQPQCGISWVTPGGTYYSQSASASVSSTSNSGVIWNSPGMASDVQGWVDSPASNFGWLLLSSTESPANTGSMQSFTKSAQLNFSFTCHTGLLDTGSGCTTCTAAAKSACVTTQAGNTCNDSGPPSSTYSCTCGATAYVKGPGGTSCTYDRIFANGFE